MNREPLVLLVRDYVSASQVKRLWVRDLFIKCPVTDDLFSLFEIMIYCDNVIKINKNHHFRFPDGSELEIIINDSGKLEPVIHNHK